MEQSAADDPELMKAPNLVDLDSVLRCVMVLAEPDPAAAARIVDQKVATDMLSYKGDNASIRLTIDAIGQSDFWRAKKSDYRVMRVNEVTIGPEMDSTIAGMASGDVAAFRQVLRNLPHWLSATRAGGCDKVVDAMVRFVAKAVGDFMENNVGDDIGEITHAHEVAQQLEGDLALALKVLPQSRPAWGELKP